jgi:hypothetical protein
LLLLRFLFLVTGMHSGDESQENEETKDFVHKLVDFPGVQQKVRPIARKFLGEGDSASNPAEFLN